MIEIHNLTKQFEDIRAVDEVSVTIREKTVFGLIGTNGAGKSTVLRMIAGVIKPDEGTVAVDNMPVYDNVEAKNGCFLLLTSLTFLQMPTRGRWRSITAAFMRRLTGRSFTGIWKNLT